LIESGNPELPGASVAEGGTNFAVYAAGASRVELCLFDAAGAESARLELPGQQDGIWHGFVPGLGAGQRYGFRAHGRYEPEAGLRFNPHKLLLDPYARELSGSLSWCDAVFDYERPGKSGRLRASTADNAAHVPRSVVTAPVTGPAARATVAWSDMLIYELNVRGFTMRHPAIDAAERGKLSALGSDAVIGHLRALGVTSVEIMPIHALIDEEFLSLRGLRNLWGYNSIGFFAIDSRFLGADGATGLQRAIATLHDAGIEVLLDVVYNHTAEGGRLGPTLSFRGLANDAYYRLVPDDPSEYINDTGCGNTLNTSHPVVRRLIVDSLRYWVDAFGVDGFRFDLATALGRTTEGFDRSHPLFREIGSDPVLAGVKLIAEPWDVGPGGYRLGAFPAGWGEWNDQFRDTLRRFWHREPGIAPDLARRVHGSSDIFEARGRGPAASVNFVASHDGFTLADLVSYAERHNEPNGENNRDGHAHNFSSNHGVEGPTGDARVQSARRRHRLNLLATLLFAQGTPMLLAGDEFGNSQSGNNNAYAQDNETGWLDWDGLTRDPDFFAEVSELTRIRRELPLLRQAAYRHGAPAPATGRAEIEWLGTDAAAIPEAHWAGIDAFALLLSRPGPDGAERDRVDAVAILYNVRETETTFLLPAVAAPGRWECRYASAGGLPPADTGDGIVLAGFSIACMVHAR